MPAFPSYPLLLFDGIKRQREPGVDMTAMESGPPKQMKKQSRVMIRRPVTYLLKTAADYAAFIAWYENTINKVDWFDWTDPADGVTKRARIQGGDLKDEAPQRKIHDRWKVMFTIETWNA